MSIAYCTGADRFGGRFSSLLNTFRLAQDYRMIPAVLWNRDHHLYADMNAPELLFSDDFIKAWFLPESFRTLGYLMGPQGLPEQMTQVHKSHDEATFRAAVKDKTPFLVTTTGRLDLPWEDANQNASTYASMFDRVEFSDQCRAIFAKIDTLFSQKGNIVGVHLRRGDIIRDDTISSRYWQGRYIPDEFFVTAMQMLSDQGKRLILFTDDQIVKAAYRDSFADLMVVDDVVAATDVPAPIYDVAEFYAMMSCAQIVAPTRSAFSQTAAEVGQRPILRVLDLLDDDQVAGCTDRLRQRRKNDLDSFFSAGELSQVDFFLERDPRIVAVAQTNA